MQVILNVNYVSHIAALIKASGCRVYFLNDGFVVIAIIIDIFIIIIEDITLMAPVKCVFLRKLPPNPEITLPLIPSSNTLVDSNTKVAGLRQLFT